MAKIQFSGLGIVQARGRLGADTISRNHTGNYTRSSHYGSPIFPSTPFGDAFSLLFQEAYNFWYILDPLIQEEWNVAARVYSQSDKIGNRIRLSGFNLFCKCTIGIFSTGNTPTFLPVFDPPLVPMLNIDVVSLSATDVTLNMFMADGSQVVSPQQNVFLCASPCVSGGRTRLYSNIPIIYQLSDFDPIDTENWLFAWSALHGTPVSGRKIFFRAWTVSRLTGFRSPEVTASGVVS